jgi:hypothetical protein
MRMEQIRALVWKDLQVHWRGAGSLLLGWPVGVRLLVLIPQTSQDVDRGALQVIVTTTSLLLFVAASAGMATMLVERERSRETLAWLRTLPVSDAHIVAGKCVTGLIFHGVGFAAWWLALGQLAPPLTVPQAITVWSVTAVIGSIALVSQMAPTAPAGLLAVAVLAGAMFGRWPALMSRAVEVWHGSWRQVPLWAACLTTCAVLFACAWWRLRAHDAQTLVD